MDDLISRDYLREIVGRMSTEWEYGAAVSDIYDIIMKAPAVDAVPVVRCKDCKYFEVKDCWADFAEVPILVSDVPTCHMWGNGECKTHPNGYCFLGKRRDGDT